MAFLNFKNMSDIMGCEPHKPFVGLCLTNQSRPSQSHCYYDEGRYWDMNNSLSASLPVDGSERKND